MKILAGELRYHERQAICNEVFVIKSVDKTPAFVVETLLQLYITFFYMVFSDLFRCKWFVCKADIRRPRNVDWADPVSFIEIAINHLVRKGIESSVSCKNIIRLQN